MPIGALCQALSPGLAFSGPQVAPRASVEGVARQSRHTYTHSGERREDLGMMCGHAQRE